MSPRESWHQIARMGVIHMEQRHRMGTNARATDADDVEYRGIPITDNMPLTRNGRTFDGIGYLSAMRVYTY